MGITYNPRTITDGLVLCLDAANPKSYPGSGTTWTDLSGNSNTGTLTNGPTYSSANGGSIAFDGSNDFINCGSINLQQNFSLELWAYTSTNSSWYFGQGIFSTNQGIHIGWYFYENRGMIFGMYSNDLDTPSFNLQFNTWYHFVFTYNHSTYLKQFYSNGVLQNSGVGSVYSGSGQFNVGQAYSSSGAYMNGRISKVSIYNRVLSAAEIQQNFNALKGRYEKGGIGNPFSSPTEARILGYTSGDYYFKSGSMSSPQLLEFQRDYYENRGWVCVFRSPYRSTATTNRIDLNIPMGGLLVQRDALDLRGAVYWSTPITYNTVGGAGNNTADSGYSPRRVILGGSGGHGIFATNQQQCNWGSATGAIGAGWDGSTCGSFPNDLVWGTGRSDTATYENRSGIWSHWITWN